MRRANCPSPGFTLLEVVVTLAVLSLSLTALYRIFSSVTMTAGMTAHYYEALKIAETRMGLLSANVSTSSSGSINGFYNWKSRVERYAMASDNPLAGAQSIIETDSATMPYLLTVSVSWGEGKKREVTLNTIRLGMAP